MPTREEKKQSEELQDIMKDEAEKAVSDEIEKIKSEIERGKTKYDQSKIKKRLEEVSKNAVDAVIAQASGSLGIIKSGEYYYPIVPQPSLVVWIPAAVGLAKLAAVGIAALAAGEGIKELDEWYHSSYKVEFKAKGEVAFPEESMAAIQESAIADVNEQANDAGKKAGNDYAPKLQRLVGTGKLSESAARKELDKVILKAVNDEIERKSKKYASIWNKIKEHVKPLTIATAIGTALFATFEIGEVRRSYEMSSDYEDALDSFGYSARSALDNGDFDTLEGILKEWDDTLNEYEKFVDSHKRILYVPESKYSFIKSSRVEKDRIESQMEKGGTSLVGRTVTGKVVRVNDGDSFAMELDDTGKYITIRVNHLNCPEKGARKGNLDLYKFCKDIAEDIILGEHVTVKITGTTGGWGDTTRYMADVSFSGGDFATVMKRDTSGECV